MLQSINFAIWGFDTNGIDHQALVVLRRAHPFHFCAYSILPVSCTPWLICTLGFSLRIKTHLGTTWIVYHVHSFCVLITGVVLAVGVFADLSASIHCYFPKITKLYIGNYTQRNSSLEEKLVVEYIYLPTVLLYVEFLVCG